MARTLALWDASFASSVEHVGRVVRLSGGFVRQRILAVTRRCGLAPTRPTFHRGNRSGSGTCASLTLVQRNRPFRARSAHREPTFAVFGAGCLHWESERRLRATSTVADARKAGDKGQNRAPGDCENFVPQRIHRHQTGNPAPCAGQKTPGLLRYLGRRLVDLFKPDGCVALGPCSADPAGENGAQGRRMGERHEDMADNHNEKA
jgi:hypothetical protein